MKHINANKPLAKYDCQNKILYLNHNQAESDIINNMISRCYEMYAIVSVERESEEKGRMGGMGGMGNMGALFSMLAGRH